MPNDEMRDPSEWIISVDYTRGTGEALGGRLDSSIAKAPWNQVGSKQCVLEWMLCNDACLVTSK